MEVFSYQTLARESEGNYREKGSKFLSFAVPVSSMQEIDALLADLRRRFHDARHHCYAWVLQADGSAHRAFDDGEPHHSAGDPILGQIRSRHITNVLVVVVRYFGGVKLGVGGLVQAYRTAAAQALDNNTIVTKEVTVLIRIEYDYTATSEVMRLVDDFGLLNVRQTFEARCSLSADVPARHSQRLSERIKLLNAMGTPVHYTFPQG
jgi:uncharacterized YigZ family protein